MKTEHEYEATRRVGCIEQQIPLKWKKFAGKPMRIMYYGTKVNTFRENPNLQHPNDSYTMWATKELRREMKDKGKYLSDADLKSIISQEWRTDLTRNILNIRLNRHGSKSGPIVHRSPTGALYIDSHEQ
ncbi:hypothetical protein Plhal304r1_c011g0043421 [Plasmopara halstedii]